jgi:demethylmenaquinone methyltransferase/2-methoxy-6-polyprenyl-1,4-benzoquinol methylase
MSTNLQSIFSEIHGRYELVNHVLSLGLDNRWRRLAAATASAGGGMRWIDLCCGTGEMTVCLKALAPADTIIFATDFSERMVHQALKKRETDGITFALSELSALPFSDASFDLATMSFATRNVNTGREQLVRSLCEIRRVLRDGGRFVNLETSRPENRFMRGIFHSYVRLFVKPIGRVLSGSKAGYAYLSSSIPSFYSMNGLSDILLEAGFKEVSSVPVMCGVAAIHRAVR